MFWVHGHYSCDRVFGYRNFISPTNPWKYLHKGFELSSFEGDLVLNNFTEDCDLGGTQIYPPPPPPLVYAGMKFDVDSAWTTPRFENPGAGGGGLEWSCQSHIIFQLPYWLLFLMSLAPSALLGKRILRRRPQDGYCVHCGYDLRATPNRCPECGK